MTKGLLGLQIIVINSGEDDQGSMVRFQSSSKAGVFQVIIKGEHVVSLPGQQQLICYADHLIKLESSCVQILYSGVQVLYSGGCHTLSSPKVAQSSAKTISKFTIQVKFMPTHYAKSFNLNSSK